MEEYFEGSCLLRDLKLMRMPHFREDHDGCLADPTQKTLSSLFGPGDARKAKTYDNVCFASDVAASLLPTNEQGLPLDNHELCCDLRDQSDTNKDLDHISRSPSKYCVEMEDSDRLPSNETEVKVNSLSTMRHDPRSYKSDETQEIKIYLDWWMKASIDQQSQRGLFPDNDNAGSSSNQKEFFVWVDDYKCSLCGAEIPPNFVISIDL